MEARAGLTSRYSRQPSAVWVAVSTDGDRDMTSASGRAETRAVDVRSPLSKVGAVTSDVVFLQVGDDLVELVRNTL